MSNRLASEMDLIAEAGDWVAGCMDLSLPSEDIWDATESGLAGAW